MAPRNALVAALLASTALGQVDRPAIHAAPGERVRTMLARHRALAVLPGGELWALVGVERQGSTALALCASRDRGRSWQRVAELEVRGALEGALAAHPDGRAIDVAFYARDAHGLNSTHLQVFDVGTRRWRGPPEVVLAATGSDDQYAVGDLERAADGTLAITVMGSAKPRSAGFVGAWGGALLVRQPGAVAFAPVLSINSGPTCGHPQIGFCGHVVHVAYTTGKDNVLAVCHRAYDTAQGEWVRGPSTASETRLTPPRAEGEIANALSFLVAGDRLLCVYALARPGVPGELRLASAAAARPWSWTTTTLAQDPLLTSAGGQCQPSDFAVVRGPGDQAVVWFAKRAAAGVGRELWRWVLADGAVIGRPRLAGELHAADLRLNGMRGAFAAASPCVLVSSFVDAAVEVVALHPAVAGTWLGRRP
jgi:hypothetical protein